jgi:hypothetical protein
LWIFKQRSYSYLNGEDQLREKAQRKRILKNIQKLWGGRCARDIQHKNSKI